MLQPVLAIWANAPRNSLSYIFISSIIKYSRGITASVAGPHPHSHPHPVPWTLYLSFLFRLGTQGEIVCSWMALMCSHVVGVGVRRVVEGGSTNYNAGYIAFEPLVVCHRHAIDCSPLAGPTFCPIYHLFSTWQIMSRYFVICYGLFLTILGKPKEIHFFWVSFKLIFYSKKPLILS